MGGICVQHADVLKEFAATRMEYASSISAAPFLNGYEAELSIKSEIAMAEHNAIYYSSSASCYIPCIQEAIDNSEYILNLEDGWDGEDAIKVPSEIYNRAITFLTEYCHSLYDSVSFDSASPSINPMSDGSIDIKWKTHKGGLLINIKNSDKKIAYYYGESGMENNKIDFNGSVNTNGVITTFQEIIKSIF